MAGIRTAGRRRLLGLATDARARIGASRPWREHIAAAAFAMTLLALGCAGCGDRTAEKSAVPAGAPSGGAGATPEPFRVGLPPGLPGEPRGGNCSLDQVGGTPVAGEFDVPAGAVVLAEGWAADADRGMLPKSAWLVLQGERGKFHVAAELGRKRPDVAAALGKGNLADSGYRVSAATQGVPAASYRVIIVSVDAVGALTCDTRQTMTIS